MSSIPQIDIAKIKALPYLHTETVKEEHLDAMGHMNIRHYLGFFDNAGWDLFANLFGLTLDYYQSHKVGMFALKQFLHYTAEVRLGDVVDIYGRVINRTPKRVHFMMFMVNKEQDVLSAMFESLGSFADLTTRRTAPFPNEIAQKIDALLLAHKALDWQPPLTGAMEA
ncbi:MAG TPA: thioesterase family protein [Aggregatilineales bacterium]|nr:thioesterase family protein [Aggregatilineales bacterium]